MSSPVNFTKLTSDISNVYPKYCHRCNTPIYKIKKATISKDKAMYCSELCFKKSKELDEYKVAEIITKSRLSKKQNSDINAVLTQEQILQIFKVIGTPTSPRSE